MPSPARRAIDALRRAVREARRVRAGADAVQRTRRSLSPEGDAVEREDSRALLQDGTLAMGRESGGLPIVRRFKGDTGRILIGNFVTIGPGVEFHCGGLHRTEWVSQYGLRAMLALPGAYEDGFPHGRGDIDVGGDAWFGQGAVITTGVTIGAGAVVATRAVVTRDVAPYTIVGGVPAKVIGRRFGDEQIAALLRIAWWDWPTDTIRARVDELCNPDIDAFIARYDDGSPGGVSN